MTPRKRLATLVKQLPEDKLPLALERLEPLAESGEPQQQAQAAEPEATEFVISYSPARKLRPPILVRIREPRAKVVMEIGVASEVHADAVEALTANARWWREHRAEITEKYHDTHIAISMGQVFTGDSYFDALASAKAHRPEDTPFVIRLFGFRSLTSHAD